MPEAVIIPDSDEGEAPTAGESAHVAAVAEGATAVQAQLAAESAEEAKAAAQVALDAAEANIGTSQAVIEAQTKAEGSAVAAGVSAEMVHEALLAQTNAIRELTEELKASRKSAVVPNGKTPSRPPEASPGGNGRRWTRR